MLKTSLQEQIVMKYPSTGQVPLNCTNQSFFNLKYLKKQTSECNKKEEDSQMERTSECFPVGRGKQEEQYRVGD